jgi:hypothetical protein
MSMTAFTRNYVDHSNDQGFQFEFKCDKCGNGWRSAYQTNTMGVAASIFRVAGSMFGGVLGRAAYAGDAAKDMLRGKAWDDAFATSVVEGKAHFKQCTRCGRWVCPEVCWNVDRSLCDECAPKLQEEMSAAQAQAAKEQVWEKARLTDQTAKADLTQHKQAACSHCGAPSTGGKFCGECGKPLQAVQENCGKCGAKMGAAAKFCPECGNPRG